MAVLVLKSWAVGVAIWVEQSLCCLHVPQELLLDVAFHQLGYHREEADGSVGARLAVRLDLG